MIKPLIERQKISQMKIRFIASFVLLCIVAGGTFTFAQTTSVPPTDNFLQVSLRADRSNSTSLNGAQVSGNIYVFAPARDVNMVSFFLDTNGNYDNNAMTSGHRTPPYDFAYTNQDGTAKPLDTKTLRDGTHTLVVTTQLISTGKYVRHSAIFTVRNTTTTVATTVAPTTIKPTTTLAPPTSTTQPVTTTTIAPNVTFGTFAGDVSAGNIRWGSATGGNGDPVDRHGSVLGKRIGLRRSFWRIDQRSSLVSTAKADVAAGRVPWVSIKLTGTWKENADGKYNTQMLALLNDLSALPGPVWFTVHHEPEGGGCKCGPNGSDEAGGAPEWLRMQQNTSSLIKGLRSQGKAKNIAFSSVLMGWTFQSQSGRNPSEWYRDGIWDFAGLDAYAPDEETSSPAIANGIPAARAFYGKKGLKLALGEWAFRTQEASETNAGQVPSAEEERLAAQRMHLMYKDLLATGSDGKGCQIIGAAYFDTSLNSGPASFEMTGSQLNAFRELISLATSIKATQK